MITKADLAKHVTAGSWRKLERIALACVESAERAAGMRMHPNLGGGTRLMLAMDHRYSHDIDLFIPDPQWLGYLTPRLNDDIAEFSSNYDEASEYLKLRFPEGEIDFIASRPLLASNTERSDLSFFMLQPVLEVIAKKLFFRAALLKPRDLFDWRTAALKGVLNASDLSKLRTLCQGKRTSLISSLARIGTQPICADQWASIMTPCPIDLLESVSWARAQLGEDFKSTDGPLPTSCKM